MIWVFLLAGLGLLMLGGEALVRGASALAARLGVSPLLIGLTVVGFGTSTPELVTSLQAAFAGSPGIAVGNVVGSNVANVLLILGVAALLMPFSVGRRAFERDGLMLVVATLACVGVILWGELTRPVGAALVAGLIVYLAYAYRTERMPPADVSPTASSGPALVGDAAPDEMRSESSTVAPSVSPPAVRLPVALAWALGGIALTVLGARLLVGAAVDLAGLWGVSDSVIGLTVVAVGTSLPELVTSVMAALRRQGPLAFGNVVGSNLYNILGILGITALVHPIPVPAQIADVDVWIMLGATAKLIVVAVTGWRVTRAEGAALLAAYAGYIAWLSVGA